MKYPKEHDPSSLFYRQVTMSLSLVPLLRQVSLGQRTMSYQSEQGTTVPTLDKASTVVFSGESDSDMALISKTLHDEPSGYKAYPALTLVYFFECRDLDHSEYLSKSLQLSALIGKPLTSVSVLDRKDLLDYLSGAKDECAGLVQSNIAQDSGIKTSLYGKQSESDAISPTTIKPPIAIDFSRVTQAERSFIQLVKSRERVLRDSTIVLLVQKTGKGFEALRAQFSQERTLKRKQEARDAVSKGKESDDKKQRVHSSKSTTHISPSKSSSQKKSASNAATVQQKPIIIVPSAVSSLITLYNAKDLLMDQNFVSSDSYREKGVKRPTQVTIMRDPSKVGPGIPTTYEVIDAVDKLKSDDWYAIY